MLNSKLCIRARENNATVFRIEKDTRRQKELLTPIATVVYQNGRVKPRDDMEISGDEMSEIQNWLRDREERLKLESQIRAKNFVFAVNAMTEWV